MGLEDLIPLAPGEFSAADKLQSPEHLAGRLDALRRFHLSDPALAQEVISYAFPNPQNRAWTQEELSEKLGLPPEPVRRIRKKKAEVEALGRYGLKVGLVFEPKVANLLHSVTPSLGAAFDAFQAERERQQLMQAMEDQRHYPAMSLTQPMMAQYAMGGGTDVAPPVHHHRHRHHHG